MTLFINNLERKIFSLDLSLVTDVMYFGTGIDVRGLMSFFLEILSFVLLVDSFTSPVVGDGGG